LRFFPFVPIRRKAPVPNEASYKWRNRRSDKDLATNSKMKTKPEQSQLQTPDRPFGGSINARTEKSVEATRQQKEQPLSWFSLKWRTSLPELHLSGRPSPGIERLFPVQLLAAAPRGI
jgi:hypothetical protein